MTEIFLCFFEISVSMTVIVAALIFLTPFLSKRYAAKWKFLIWILLALRLVIPVNGRNLQPMLAAMQHKELSAVRPETAGELSGLTARPPARVTIEIPAQMTTEIAVQSKKTGITLLDLAAFVWAAGGLMFLSLHVISYLHYKRRLMRRGYVTENADILQSIAGLKQELHIGRTVTAVVCPEADSPMMIGFLKPLLVLPQESYSREDMFFILKHELVHFKRGDVFYKLLFVAANAVHWFNPLIYVMQKEAGVDMELSCDERVLQGTDYAERKAYTETLLAMIHRRSGGRTVLSTQFYGGKQIMKKRFKNILTKKGKKNGVAVVACTMALSIGLGTLVGCSMVKESAGDQKPQFIPVSGAGKEGNPVKPLAATGRESSPFQRMAGSWIIDFDRTDPTLWGTGISYGDEMILSETGEFRYYIGIGVGGTGQCEEKQGEIMVKVEPFEEIHAGEETLTLKYVNDDGSEYILMDWNGEAVYWKRGSNPAGDDGNGDAGVGASSGEDLDVVEPDPADDDWYRRELVYTDNQGRQLEIGWDDEGTIFFIIDGLTAHVAMADHFVYENDWRVYTCDDATMIVYYPGHSGVPASVEICAGEFEGIYKLSASSVWEMQTLLGDFGKAYFSGDAAALQKLLASPQGNASTYEGAGTVDSFTVKGLPDEEGAKTKDKWNAQLEFMDSTEDSYTYLALSLVKQEDCWKVQSYGLEK